LLLAAVQENDLLLLLPLLLLPLLLLLLLLLLLPLLLLLLLVKVLSANLGQQISEWMEVVRVIIVRICVVDRGNNI
jgi:hypothetical protein